MKSCLPLLAFVMSSCALVSYTPLKGEPRQPLAEDAVVEVFITKQPDCPYDEVGILQSRSHDLATAVKGLQKKARKVGVSSIIVTGNHSELVGVTTRTTVTTGRRGTAQVNQQTSASNQQVVEAVAIELRCGT